MAGYDLVCIGDAFCDVIARRIPRLPPPNEQAATDIFFVRGGETANTAAAAARLGLRAAFVGKVGKDVFGDWLEGQLRFSGVDTFLSRDPTKSTAVTLALSLGNDDRRFVSDPGANISLRMREIDLKLLDGASHVLRGGIWHTQSLLSKNRQLFKAAKECGCSTSLNMGWDYGGWTAKRKEHVYSCLSFLDFIFLNERELSALAGAPPALLSRGVGAVVVHKGERGCRIVSGEEDVSVKAFGTKVLNPVGAGDVFNAGFIYGSLKGWALEKTAEFANAAAALHISKKNYLPTAKDVRRFLRKR